VYVQAVFVSTVSHHTITFHVISPSVSSFAVVPGSVKVSHTLSVILFDPLSVITGAVTSVQPGHVHHTGLFPACHAIVLSSKLVGSLSIPLTHHPERSWSNVLLSALKLKNI